jgi:hypothetical protein
MVTQFLILIASYVRFLNFLVIFYGCNCLIFYLLTFFMTVIFYVSHNLVLLCGVSVGGHVTLLHGLQHLLYLTSVINVVQPLTYEFSLLV